MSVYRRMLGRELPCGLGDLLRLQCPSADAARHERLVQHSDLHPTGENLLNLGLSHLALGRLGRARSTFEQAVSLRPACANARLALAAVHERLAEHCQAARQIDSVLSIPSARADNLPARSDLLRAAAFACERSGDWKGAASRYCELLVEEPNDVFSHHRLVAIYLARGQSAEAALHLQTILNHHPADTAARTCLAHLLQLDGRCAEAVWSYEQALCLEPDSWELPVDVACQLHVANGDDAVVDILEKLVGAQPHFPDLRLRLGNVYSLRGDDAAALAQFQRALSLHPDYLDCVISLGRHECRMGRHDAAAEHFRHAVAINNQHVETYVGLALAMRRLPDRVAQAAEVMASAARISKNSAVLVAQIGGLAQARQEDASEVPTASEIRKEWIEDQLDRDGIILSQHPGWNDVRVRSALLQRLLGESAQAMELLRAALLHDPACRAGWMQLGLLFVERGEGDNAASAFESALALDPRSNEMEYRVALVYCNHMEFDLAMERIESWGVAGSDIQRRVWVAIDGMRMERPKAPPPRQQRSVSVGRD